MTKAEKLARRLFELHEAQTRDKDERSPWEEAHKFEHELWRNVARGLLRDQERERKAKR